MSYDLSLVFWLAMSSFGSQKGKDEKLVGKHSGCFYRLKALEKVNTFTEEDADTATQQAVEDLQNLHAQAAEQVSALKNDLQSLRAEADNSMAASQKDAVLAADSLRKELDAKLQTLAKDQRQERVDVSARFRAQDRAVERQMAELRGQLSSRQAELRDRLNFHENLIMDEQHCSKTAAGAVSTSERLDSIAVQVQALEEAAGATAGLREEMSNLQKESKARHDAHRREGTRPSGNFIPSLPLALPDVNHNFDCWQGFRDTNFKPMRLYPVGAEFMEENFRRATSVLHDEIAEMKGVLGKSSEAAADKLEQMQRSQIYLEQKMLNEIASEKTALEKMVQRADAHIASLDRKVSTMNALEVHILT